MRPSFAEALVALSRFAALNDLIYDADELGQVALEQKYRSERQEKRRLVCEYVGVPYRSVEGEA